jgi:tripartite ATP-independent transporter DctM subunit
MSIGAEFAFFFGMLLVFLSLGLWAPFAIGIAGAIALFEVGGWNTFRAFGLVTWGTTTNANLTAIPLFILMAEVITHSGVSKRFYDGFAILFRRIPGGLLQTNIIGCAIFAAISGASVATSASMGSVALPQLSAKNYDRAMSAGSLAAGGTLGILIPPSLTMIIYGSLTDTSIAKLFMAGMIPGLLLAGVYIVYIGIRCAIQKDLAPVSNEPATLPQIVRALVDLSPFLGLMITVLGSIYLGVATPTEAAAVGSSLAILMCVTMGGLTWRGFRDSMIATIKVSSTLVFIILCAYIFSYAVEMAGIGTAIVNLVKGLGLGKFGFLTALLVMYALLGCVMDGAGMLVLTVPLLQATLREYNVDFIWFGVFLVLQLELGMLTPPFGLNLFVINSISKWPMETIIRGAVPYQIIIVAYVFFLMAFPEVALWLPSRM